MRLIDPSLRIAAESLTRAVEFREWSKNPALSKYLRECLRSVMRRHALDSRRSFAGQLLYSGHDPRNAGDLPLKGIPR